MSSLSGEAAARGAVVSRSCRVADVSYRAFLAARDAPRIHWADPDGLELSGVGTAATVTAAGSDRFDAVREWASALFDDTNHDGPHVARPRLLGGFAFHDDHSPSGTWRGFPAAQFVLPEVQLASAGEETWLTVTRAGEDVDPTDVDAALADAREDIESLPAMQPSGPRPGVQSTTPTSDEASWREQVARAVERIEAGDLRKVVLATALRADLEADLDPRDLLERLRQSYPSCFRFLVEPTGDAAFLGATPERLVTLDDDGVETVGLAGSVGRGDTPEEDAELAARLRDSEKLRHEQRLVTDTIAAKLEEFGDVTVGERSVRKLSNIQHLSTPITADVSADTHVLDVAEALHPTPAVGGLPPDAALDVIRETETFDRGWYAAPVGWVDGDGDGTFAVGLRSAVARDRTVTMFAGNGIVADSDPSEEYEEVQLKYQPILDELRS
ncbi:MULTISPECIES: isochorismate synthase MenF [Halobacterium]|uniref:isochorismate synthase n=1 Tax=Halobacterium TaxID=2239 RepID=UPI00073E1403|nr:MULTISPECIES: isochorismate synthase [Halobacterium]MCG1003052.1 isochorismate synthase [Halobacterium noricense]